MHAVSFHFPFVILLVFNGDLLSITLWTVSIETKLTSDNLFLVSAGAVLFTGLGDIVTNLERFPSFF